MDYDPERGGIEDAPEPKDKVQVLKDQVDGVKNIMTQNVDRILARGERLDDLMGKSEDLQAG
ncbi:Vesicle-associated membrane protein 8, partial [Goodea atripinnis]